MKRGQLISGADHRYLRLPPDAKGKSVISSNSKLTKRQPRTGLKMRCGDGPVIVSIIGYSLS
jgi:hypothetical protein